MTRAAPRVCVAALALALGPSACGRPEEPGTDRHSGAQGAASTPDPVAAAVSTLLDSPPPDDGEDDSRIKALAALGEPAIGAIRARLSGGNERVRLLAVQALAAILSDQAVDPLLAALTDASWQVRLEAVRALGARRARRAVAPLVRQLDTDGDPQVRYDCLTSLGLIGDPQVVPRVTTELDSADPYARMWAMDALCVLQAPDAPALFLRLLADPDVLVRRQVVRSCHLTARTDAARHALLDMTLGDPDFESSFVAREALADDFRSAAVDDPVRTLIEHQALAALAAADPVRARRGAFLLANVGDRRAFDALLLALRDPDALMRHHAAHLLAEIADPRAVAPLAEALRDDAPLVRLTAATSLQRYATGGNAQARQALADFVAHRQD